MSYVLYNGQMVQVNHKYVISSVPVFPAIYAGTTPGAKVLKSVDQGLTFSSQGTAGLGNPKCFCQLNNGNVLYGTTAGYVVNHTQSTSASIASFNQIYSITQAFDSSVYVGESALWKSIDNGVSFSSLYSGLFRIEKMIPTSGSNVLLFQSTFTDKGIWLFDGTNHTLVQAGDFHCAVDAGGGTIFAGENNGHLWKSINSGASWSDLGDIVGITVGINVLIIANGGRLILRDNNANTRYSDNGGSSFTSLGGFGTSGPMVYVSGDIFLKGQDATAANIFRSVNNGLDAPWPAIAGNPQQSESGILSLFQSV